MDRLYTATRKGLIEIDRSGTGRWRPGRCHFEAEPVSLALLDPRDGMLLAALRHGHFGVKLHRSTDGGTTWTELAPPVYPIEDGEGGEGGASLDMIWALADGGADRPGRLWAGTLPGGLFRSDDHGDSWQLVESLWRVPERAQWFGGGFDHPGIHSVLVDPRASDRLTVAISCGGVWKSDDAGESWRLVGSGLRAEYMPEGQDGTLAVQDPHLVAACRSQPDMLWCQHHNGIFRSTDGGEHWQELTSIEPRFGFAVAVHPDDPETAFFVPAVKDEHRVPRDQRLVVHRTRDGGQSFEVLSKGLPEISFDLVFRHALAIDASGDWLAMGSTTGNLWVSEDAGETWQLVSAHLPPIHQVFFG